MLDTFQSIKISLKYTGTQKGRKHSSGFQGYFSGGNSLTKLLSLIFDSADSFDLYSVLPPKVTQKTRSGKYSIARHLLCLIDQV